MRTKILLPLLLGLVTLSGCSGYQESFVTVSASQQPRASITISDYHFNPQLLTVERGELLLWKNNDRDSHTLMYDGKEVATIAQGTTFSLLADIPGTYKYTSSNHPFMEGTIIVR